MDSELLIAAIERRPCIWDVFHEDYQDRNRTKSAWVQVCKEFYPEYDVLSEGDRNALLTSIQKKWRNFRDCFVKDLKATKRTASGSQKPVKRRKYIFFDRLTFLTKTVQMRKSTSQTADTIHELHYQPSDDLSNEAYYQQEEGDEYLDERVEEKLYPICDLNDSPRPSKPSSSTMSCSPERKDHWLSEPLPHSLATDEDMAFFFSLLPSVKKFNEDTKFEFRMELMKLVKRMRTQQQQADGISGPSTST
ncbi:uncharacterized protein [Halyomorpha halys]|uniref:uncharacterized protein n=1 Tax=Halyomorpha halys TaxID=286706 RepID=UPI0006D514CE|nr:uncharacterized protein LOC106685024 [Halyomorpha halys]